MAKNEMININKITKTITKRYLPTKVTIWNFLNSHLSASYPKLIKGIAFVLGVLSIIALIIIIYFKNLLVDSPKSAEMYIWTYGSISLVEVLLIFVPNFFSYLFEAFAPNKNEELVALFKTTYLEYLSKLNLRSSKLIINTKTFLDFPVEIINHISGIFISSIPEIKLQKQFHIVEGIFYIHLLKEKREILNNYNQIEIILSRIKSSYLTLSENQKKEFIAFHWNYCITNADKSLNDLFVLTNNIAEETAKHTFTKNYLKENFIDELINKIKKSEADVNQFKKAISQVTQSQFLSLNVLEKAIDKRKYIGKLFLVTSQQNLSSQIQAYIRSQPYFILDYSSIDNLPHIGTSKRFDIFFFSPPQNINNAEKLWRKFCSLDNKVKKHAIRIYEIDPSSAFSNNLSSYPEIEEALFYFETYGMDFRKFKKLNYKQIITLMNEQNIQVSELIGLLPPSEFISEIIKTEKENFNLIVLNKLKEENITLFEFHKIYTKIKKDISKLKEIPVSFKKKEISSISDKSKISLNAFKARLTRQIQELNKNIRTINEMGIK